MRPALGWMILVGLICAMDATAQSIEFVNSCLWTGVADVEVVGNYAYASFRNGLQILDVADPANPHLVSQVVCPMYGAGLDVHDGYVYLADGDSTVCIINVNDPLHPFLTSTLHVPGFASDIAYSNGYIFAACWWGGFQIADVSDPTNPHAVAGYGTNSGSWGICVSGNYAYMADGEAGLRVFDISNLSQPTLLATVPVRRFAHDVKAVGDYVYVATTDTANAGLWIVDVSNPSAPVIVNQGGSWDDVFGVDIVGHYAYMANMRASEVHIIDISNPAAPSRTGTWRGPDYCEPQAVRVIGNTMYVAGGNSAECTFVTPITGVYTVDVSNPSAPVSLGRFDASGSVEDVAIAGHYAYIAAEDPALQVVDLSTPGIPRWTGTGRLTMNLTNRVAVSGHYAFLTSDIRGMYVFDISDPAHPDSAAYYDGVQGYYTVAARGSLAYLGTYLGVAILDLSTFPSVRLFSECPTDDQVTGMALMDNRLFVTSLNGFKVFDLSDSLNPYPIGSSADTAYDVAVSGNYAYLTKLNWTLAVLDVSDPAAIHQVGSCATTGRPYRVALQGNRAWIAETTSGVEVMDISDPAHPAPLAYHDTPGNARAIATTDSLTYVADVTSLMGVRLNPTAAQVLQHSAENLALLPNYPNPFNGTTTLTYTLDRHSPVELAVYDVLGRKAATLFSGTQTAGEHRVNWNAERLASGIYFAVLKAGTRTQTQKMVLLK